MRNSPRPRRPACRPICCPLLAFAAALPCSASITTVGNQLWHLDSLGVSDQAETVDLFGSATATGDFDGDGYADLAIGIPRSDLLLLDDVGSVLVLYGSPLGLSSKGSQILRQEGEGIEEGDLLGSVLVAGDFDGDGYDDLAVGAPMEEVGGDLEAGAVSVFYGSLSGLGQLEDWHQGVAGIPGALEEGDRFGHSLATGDFDNDGYDDLAVGSPGDSVSGQAAAGMVHVIYGSGSGLSSTDSQRLRQGFGGLADTAEPDDGFGYSLAAGDFDGDGWDDLAIGVVFEGLASADGAGAVHVLRGTDDGLDTDDDLFLSQGKNGLAGAAEPFDSFGLSLAAGDVDGDGRDDLAVGVPGQDVTGSEDGQLHLVFGSAEGLVADGNFTVDRLTPGVVSSEVDFFAFVLASGDVDGDGLADVVVGTPGQDVERPGEDPAANAGGVHVLYGSATSGLGAIEWVSHYSLTHLVGGVPAVGDQFGSALAVGDFDDDGGGELAVGIPNRLVSGQPAAGAVAVFTSGIFGDGFESGDMAAWSGTSP